MRLYETTIVIDSFVKSDDMQNIVNKFQNFLKNNGGEIRKVEDWGKRRLAFEINRKQYGNYFHIIFEGPSTLPKLLEREYRLEESILRYLTVQSDPKVLESEEKKTPKKPSKTSVEPTIKDSETDEDFSSDVEEQEKMVDEEIQEIGEAKE